jgi:hypothetical protein
MKRFIASKVGRLVSGLVTGGAGASLAITSELDLTLVIVTAVATFLFGLFGKETADFFTETYKSMSDGEGK